MDLFTVFSLKGFIKHCPSISSPMILPPYLQEEAKIALLQLTIGGLNYPNVSYFMWPDDLAILESNSLSIKKLLRNIRNNIIIVKARNDQDLIDSINFFRDIESIAVIYFPESTCSLKKLRWLIEIRDDLITYLEQEYRKIFSKSIDDVTINSLRDAFCDPLDILAFFNEYAARSNSEENISSIDVLSHVLANKVLKLGEREKIILLRFITEYIVQDIITDNVVDIDLFDLKSLEINGFIRIRTNLIQFRNPLMIMRENINLFINVFTIVGLGKMDTKGQLIYKNYINKFIQPTPVCRNSSCIGFYPVSSSAIPDEIKNILAKESEIAALFRPANIDQVWSELYALENYYNLDFKKYRDLNNEELENKIKNNKLIDAISLAIRTCYLISGEQSNFDRGLELSRLSYSFDKRLLKFRIAVVKHLVDQSIYLENFKKALSYLEIYLKDGGDLVWYLLKKGIIHAQIGEYAKARISFDQGIKESDLREDKRLKGRLLLQIGILDRINGRLIESLGKSELAFHIFSDLDEKYFRAQALVNIGNTLRIQGKYNDSICNYKNALSIFESLNDSYRKACVQGRLGMVYRQKGDTEEAFRCFKLSLEFFKIHDKNREGLILKELGATYLICEDYDKALTAYTDAMNIFITTNNHLRIGQARKGIGSAKLFKNNVIGAIDDFFISLEIFSLIHDELRRANVLNNIGIAYLIQNRWPEAISKLEESREIFRKLGDRVQESLTLEGLGYAYKIQGNNNDAIKKYLQSLKVIESIGDQNRKLWTYIKLSWIYSDIRNYDDALNAIKEAQNLSDYLTNLDDKIWMLAQIAEIFGNMYKYEESIKLYKKALDLNNEDSCRKGWILGEMGTAYRRMNLIKQSEKCFEESLGIFEKLSNNEAVGWILEELGEIFRSTGQNQKAIAQYKHSLNILKIKGSSIEKNLLNIAQVNLMQTYYMSAIEKYKGVQFSENIPQSIIVRVRALLGLGDTLRRIGDFEGAKNHLNESKNLLRNTNKLDLIGKNICYLGLVFRDQKFYTKSLECFNEGKKLFIDIGDKFLEIWALIHIANVLLIRNNWEEAISISNSIIREDPKSLIGHLSLALCYKELGQDELFKIEKIECENFIGETYEFSWDKIPKIDNIHFIKFLTKNLGNDWTKIKKIEKSDNTIKVFGENKSILLNLNHNKTEVFLETDDGKSMNLRARLKEEELEIYNESIEQYDWACFESICGDKKRSLEFLTEALKEKRLRPALVENDPHLIPIKNDPEFTRILSKYCDISFYDMKTWTP